MKDTEWVSTSTKQKLWTNPADNTWIPSLGSFLLITWCAHAQGRESVSLSVCQRNTDYTATQAILGVIFPPRVIKYKVNTYVTASQMAKSFQ